MMVWVRCEDCEKWSEDCTCLCGFEPENEESLIWWAERINEDLDSAEREQTRKELGYCTAPDCYRCGSEDYEHYDYDCYDRDDDDYRDHYDYDLCYRCHREDCHESHYGECDWEVFGKKASEEWNNPLRVLSRALEETACPA
jgi:hypothetical protein